jgi:hypothetical protein
VQIVAKCTNVLFSYKHMHEYLTSINATNIDKSIKVYGITRTLVCVVVILTLMCRVETRTLVCFGETNNNALYNIFQFCRCSVYIFVDCYTMLNNYPKLYC